MTYNKYPPPPAAGAGTVTEVRSGTGLTGGPIVDNGTLAMTVPVTVAHGGTNSVAALTNGKLMRSTAGAVVESGITIDASNNLKVGATGAITASTALEVSSVLGAFLLPRMTTTQRDALTAANGMVLYNTTDDKIYARVAGSWVSLLTL